MHEADQRASRIDQMFARFFKPPSFAFADPMRRDQHIGSFRNGRSIAFRRELKTALFQLILHGFVMHQLPVDRDEFRILNAHCLGEGISHSKAQPHRISSDDVHQVVSPRTE